MHHFKPAKALLAIVFASLAALSAQENPYQPPERTVTLNPVVGYQWVATPHGRVVGYTGEQALRVNQHDRQQAHTFALHPNSALRLNIGSISYALRGTVPGATVRFILAFDGVVTPLDPSSYSVNGGTVSGLFIVADNPTILAIDITVTGVPGEVVALTVPASAEIVDGEGRVLALGQALEIPIHHEWSITGNAYFLGYQGPIEPAYGPTAPLMQKTQVAPMAPLREYEVILTWKTEATAEQRSELLQQLGMHPFGAPFGRASSYLIRTRNTRSEIVAQLETVAEWNLLSVHEPIQLQSGNPLAPYQWDKQAIGIAGAWEITTGSSDVRVAVIDTGIDPRHQAFAGRLVDGIGFSILGKEAERDQGIHAFRDSLNSHGTHVAGIIGAGKDWGGTIGVAPEISLIPIRVFNRKTGTGGGPVAELMFALIYAGSISDEQLQQFDWYETIFVESGGSNELPRLSRPADVINMSFGGRNSWPPLAMYLDLLSAAYENGSLLIAAAGNGDQDGLPEALRNEAGLILPAGHEDVLAISATNIKGLKASYSNFGDETTPIFIAAPGGEGAKVWEDQSDGGYYSSNVYIPHIPRYGGILAPDMHRTDPKQANWTKGTSMAAPQVAGVAALMKSVKPELDPQDIKNILAHTAIPIGDSEFYGHGLLRADRAVRAAQYWPAQPPEIAKLVAVHHPFIDSQSDGTIIHIGNIFGGFDLLGELSWSVVGGMPPWMSIARMPNDGFFERWTIVVDRSHPDYMQTLHDLELSEGLLIVSMIVESEHADSIEVPISIVVHPIPEVPDVDITFYIVDEFTHRIVEKRTIPSFGLHPYFSFSGLPQGGHYRIFAGTDWDGNGLIDQAGCLIGNNRFVLLSSSSDGPESLSKTIDIMMTRQPNLIAPDPAESPESNQ
ncbi:MAG: hypothetical protein EA401_02385 [Planctomycetota bacterium]|nr:MAG: hypothetical protein EA401_02385 [Planctomycetota bacterium]